MEISRSHIPHIQQIEPSYVASQLISKPYGTFLIRSSTENDDILSEIRINPEIETASCPYFVLSVRVDETEYKCPIMNYRLSQIGPNSEENRTPLLEQYYRNENNPQIDKLPRLTKEHSVPNTDWMIDQKYFIQGYNNVFASAHYGELDQHTICTFGDKNKRIAVYNKRFENNDQDFQHEFSILKNLCYFHIISLYGICLESYAIKYLVFADHGDELKTICPLNDNPHMSIISQMVSIGYQIACGMIYLDHKKIIHRDLHAKNILIDKYGYVRIADFGHAIIKDSNDDRYQQTINIKRKYFQTRRLAPECLASPPENGPIKDSYDDLLTHFSAKSDVWAFGLIFIELMMENTLDVYPYLMANDGGQEVIEYVKVDRKIHEPLDEYPEKIYNVLEQCWAYYPEDRISFMDIRKEMIKIFKSIENEDQRND